MLKNWNHPEKPEKEELKQRLDAAKEKLETQQMLLKDKKLPVLVLIEGWGAAGKGSAIGTALASLIIGLMRFGMPLCFKVNTQYLDIPIGILLIVVVVGRAAANHPKTAALFAKLKRKKERPAVKTAK